MTGGACGEHEGNLQVGWWKVRDKKQKYNVQNNSEVGDEYSTVQPVFMDIWRQEFVETKSDNYDNNKNKSIMTVIPRTALYVRKKNAFGLYNRVYITRNFDAKDPVTGAARDNYDKEFLDDDEGGDVSPAAHRYLRIEDIPAWERGDDPAGTLPHITPPKGGSLVLFDSVCLPHEVMETLEGERLVLAGWLHEAQQPVAKWFEATS